MSNLWDFDDSFTEEGTSRTQQIHDNSIDEDDEMVNVIGPTQAIHNHSDNDEEIEPEERSPSPIFHSRVERSPSPVFLSQSLLCRPKNKQILPQSNESQEFVEPSQIIDSEPSTQKSETISGPSAKISSAESSMSLEINPSEHFHSFYQSKNEELKKPKRPKKGGLVEKLDISLKKQASDQVLSHHLPLKLRGSNVETRTAKVTQIWSQFSTVILKCLDYKLNREDGKRQEFLIILDPAKDLEPNQTPSDIGDVTIEGPWLSFPDSEGTEVISNVFKCNVIIVLQIKMGDSDHETDDITIPRAAMNKMIKELCPQIRVANEARELILNCCTEFIHLVSSEANDICNNQQKKTINAEHVLQALEKLGYGDFRKDAEDALAECKEVAAKRKRQNTRLEQLGISQEELRRQQQELFAKAKEEAARQEQQMLLQQQMQVATATASTSAPPTSTVTSSSSDSNNGCSKP